MMCDEVAARYAICASRGSSDWFRCHADANVDKQGYTTISERVNLVTCVIRDVCRIRLAFSEDRPNLTHPRRLSRGGSRWRRFPLVALSIIFLEQTCL